MASESTNKYVSYRTRAIVRGRRRIVRLVSSHITVFAVTGRLTVEHLLHLIYIEREHDNLEANWTTLKVRYACIVTRRTLQLYLSLI